MTKKHIMTAVLISATLIFAGCSNDTADTETLKDVTNPDTVEAENPTLDTQELETPEAVNAPLWDPNANEIYDTESGIQYFYLAQGESDAPSPTAEDEVIVHYEGQLVDGTVFDSSYERAEPARFGLNQVIAGWTEGLQLMRVGDIAVLNIPPELAYGDTVRAGGIIQPGSNLVFKVELLEIPKIMKITEEAWAKYTPWDSSNPDVETTDSGLGIIVLESGDASGVSPKLNQQCEVHYEGRLASTGDVFDSSFARGESITFAPNQVIPGWTEALTRMKPGDRWLVNLPSDIAYGARNMGPIPANSDLTFEIALIKVK